MESILTSIKKMLGIPEEYAHFDTDIIMFINDAFMSLRQIGVGPASGFSISSDEQTWRDFIGESTEYEAIKTYIYLKVKMVFDPPANSFVLAAMERQAQEREWRLNTQAETEVQA